MSQRQNATYAVEDAEQRLASSLRMHYLRAGKPSAPLAVFLHGFPELSESWRDILVPAAEQGLFAVAPDLRGYGQTDKPEAGYDVGTLAEDIAQLVEALGKTRAHLIGHDWGGAVAYQLARLRPELVESLCLVNSPPPPAMLRALRRPAQLLKSWYMFFFQIPWLPERLLSFGGGAVVARMLETSAVDPSRLAPALLEKFARNFADVHTARCALAYYRQAFRALLPGKRRNQRRVSQEKIRAPFRLVWGTLDIALTRDLTLGLERWFAGPHEVVYLNDVGHFGMLEAAERVIPAVLEFLPGRASASKVG